MSDRKPTFGFLTLGMVIGFGIGLIILKQDHNVLWLIIGPIIGAVAGGYLESSSRRKSP